MAGLVEMDSFQKDAEAALYLGTYENRNRLALWPGSGTIVRIFTFRKESYRRTLFLFIYSIPLNSSLRAMIKDGRTCRH